MANCGLWASHLDLEAVLDKGRQPNYPFIHDRQLYWLQALSAEEQGRTALVRESDTHDYEIITPENFDIRTRVNEYGGKCFCIVDDYIVFNNFLDGSLYAQRLSSDNAPLKLAMWHDQKIPGFADLVASPDCKWIVAVMEVPHPEGENRCRIVKIEWDPRRLGNGGHHQIETLASGADFYASPTISADQSRLAWIEWSHPCMPWDQTRLACAGLDSNGQLLHNSCTTVIDREDWSVCQIGFMQNGDLIFISDNPDCDFWNFYRWSASGELAQISHEQGEFGEPHWVFGQARWQELSAGVIAAVLTDQSGDRIVELQTTTGHCRNLTRQEAAFRHLSRGENDSLLCVASYENRMSSIVQITPRGLEERMVANSGPKLADDVPKPEFVEFPTTKGQVAYGLFFTPMNPDVQVMEGERPPLMVMIHGGPTGRSSRAYAGIRHYFSSLGFAVLDVNHRGSTGFGRTFRQSLSGNWGVDDCEDIVAGIQHLVNQQRVDPDLVFIRGSSAGGYAVLRALTRHNRMFCAGASYYGIGNLITLSEITHRFESRYVDRLIGEKFDRVQAQHQNSRYTERSPVFALDRLNCPLILFQGLDDKVVPPELSREVADLLKSKGIRHAYHEYPGEGHGFRKQETRLDALNREIDFFSEIIRQRHAAGEN